MSYDHESVTRLPFFFFLFLSFVDHRAFDRRSKLGSLYLAQCLLSSLSLSVRYFLVNANLFFFNACLPAMGCLVPPLQ
jgi:hypothetical protein